MTLNRTTDPAALAVEAAPLVFRTDLDQPGFAHFDLGTGPEPSAFRGLLVAVGRALAGLYQERFGEALHFVSMSRFDQQAATRPHRDGGPDASVLLLGYEPTEVPSRVYLMDYTRAARERGLTPLAYLDCCNPAFGGDERALHAHTAEVTAFRWEHYQVLIVNNSCLPWEERHRGMMGLLHHAVIPAPRPGLSRAIDSLLMGLVAEGLDEEALAAFVEDARAATR
jgi:hypothetical protein